ncbi:hypothetical protein B7494_g7265 [Chlorociboria aeruginascens]|nr:hypothetical protein B7494_g7265 [Chlorociboria aeruginascens]
MSKRTVFTTLTALPPGMSRETVLETLHSHVEMIDLNPLVIERHPIKPPPTATPEEFHCLWYSLTDRVQYLPKRMASGKISYSACFHDLPMGLQTHVYAPLGLEIKGKWTLGGSLPGEPVQPVELGLGAPLQGLYLREDVDMKCNLMMTSFVKKTLRAAHSKLVDRLVVKAQIVDASIHNNKLFTGQQVPSSSRYSSSETDVQSVTTSPRLSTAPQSPPLPSPTFTWTSEKSDSHNQIPPYDPSLLPNALSIRSSSPQPSYDESVSYNQPTRPSQKALAGMQDGHVSWQGLNVTAMRTSSSHSADLRASYGGTPTPLFHAELPSEERPSSVGRIEMETQPAPVRYMPYSQAYELE